MTGPKSADPSQCSQGPVQHPRAHHRAHHDAGNQGGGCGLVPVRQEDCSPRHPEAVQVAKGRRSTLALLLFLNVILMRLHSF